VGPRCHARENRPLGCRAFFCGAEASDSQAIYESYHARIRQLHQRHGLAYRYVELTWALTEE
jgi:Fe-S-cluster containining protein